MLEAANHRENNDRMIRHERNGKVWEIPKRRSVKTDFDFYDGPQQIWERITARKFPYHPESAAARASLQHTMEATERAVAKAKDYTVRDVAFLSLLYIGTFRVSEICRVTESAGYNAGCKPGIQAKQFTVIPPFLRLRGAITLKRLKYDKETKTWLPIRDFNDPKYRVRGEINIPLEGPLSRFGLAINRHLYRLDPEDELFPFNRQRGHQLVKHLTDWTPHAFRSMGLKLYSRLVDRNIADLQKFSGHARLEALRDYLGEGQLERKLLEGPRDMV